MERLILVRHAHAASNVDDVVSCTPPGEGLSEHGRREATRLGDLLAEERIDLAVVSELVRTQETLELAVGSRSIPRLVLSEWNEIDFGAFEAGPLEDYRAWAWSTDADAECPGGGETRAAIAARVAGVLEALLGRTEHTILAIGHALPVRYVLDAAGGRVPRARIEPVPHAQPHPLDGAQVAGAARVLREWSRAPVFAPSL
jgi:broad specificity phosphatase PhoE